jgi:hypothetical protein
MAKISQAVAQDVATKITKKLYDKQIEIENQISALVEQVYVDSIPAPVMAAYKKYEKWMHSSYSTYISGRGIDNRYRVVSYSKPYPRQGSSTERVELPDDVADQVVKLMNLKETTAEKYKKTKLEIENTILALGTHKRVCAEMPQAAQYLPQGNSMQLMVNVAPVNEKINCLLSTESACMEQL